ncbi:SDR family NAD(P)-dependent oxidoreductase [Corynebacterium lizhenjunii]|uniref:SDR family NAD(P)-dependent oxidoreductase n=1 Tax=Corynebacterium lizhenjunii TaxID=2709394 RepID=A0A7T0KEL8_9CORY|nr:SDR family NAD(P)-dependent oxidoreductase [Corynebacterium lizhenjunii]QPK79109.1 SDR family NAD(P)-dependent oxidoreductase [Corynebacterium lizhenjunii]
MIANQRVLITGAGSGLGKALAQRFVEHGAQVALVDVDLDRARAAAEEIGLESSLPLAADVRDTHSLHSAVDQAVTAFGGLDTVVPNAGIWDYYRSITRLSGEEIGQIFDEVMAVNVKGYLLTAEATWRHLLRAKGSMIFTLSNSAFYAAGGGAPYTASKFAARGLVIQLAHELAPHIRVNGVAVGGMRTNLAGPVSGGLEGRTVTQVFDGRPEGGNPYIPLHDISLDPITFTGSYLLLADPEEAGNITGHIINADGGIAARGFAHAAGGDELC